MPKLIIDHRAIEVPPGSKVIEAAERLGIMIPRFCYHEALGSVGACRMCAVKFLDGPVKGLRMSCMEDARDGMVVSTTDPEAVEFRQFIIECLMLNHPLDCPVCDEGGQCFLQDMTVSGGHGMRRYGGLKRTHRDQDLGPLVQHEMNRCIHCWRCRRFYQDVAGYRDLGALQIGSRTYFGRFRDGALESPFAGNLIDLCPTGVYTDRPARFMGRRWDFERAPSLCPHCSLGCNTIASARYREVVRQEAGPNPVVNGFFICDRGRFSFGYANHPQRPRQAHVDDAPVSWDQARGTVGERLDRLVRENGPEVVACLGSTRNSLEAQAQLLRLCRVRGWRDPLFFVDPMEQVRVRAATSRLDASLAISLKGIEQTDCTVVIGADPINEAPMLALALRQAWREGATVVVIDPRPVQLPFAFTHLALSPAAVNEAVKDLVRAVRDGAAESTEESTAAPHQAGLTAGPNLGSERGKALHDIVGKLRASRNPAVVCGTDITTNATPHLAADLAELLKTVAGRAGLFYLLPGANAFSAGLLTPPESDFEIWLGAMETGRIKALILVEADPFFRYPDRERLSRALDQLELLVVLDYMPTPAVARAHVSLPTRTLFEAARTTFVNQEGRLQTVSAVHRGGIPITQLTGGGHPPRSFSLDIPGGDPSSAHEILGRWAEPPLSTDSDEIRQWLAQTSSRLAVLAETEVPSTGLRVLPERSPAEGSGAIPEKSSAEREPADAADTDGQWDLLLVDWTFGTEELSRYAETTRRVAPEPKAFMHEDDAGDVGLESGDILRLPVPDGDHISVVLETTPKMAKGVIVLPRHHSLDWHKLKSWRPRLARHQLERG